MAWLLFILFLFFAWRAAAYFGKGRPKPAILCMAACAVFLAGIFTSYIISQRQAGEPAIAAAPADAQLAEAPAAAPAPAASPAHDPAELDAFYGEVDDVPVDDAEADAAVAEETGLE
jgi:hypothetical protein